MITSHLYTCMYTSRLQGDVVTDDDTIFELAACAMQAQYGEFKRSGYSTREFTSEHSKYITDQLLTKNEIY